CTVSSTSTRFFSDESTTCADTSASPKRRSSFSRREAASFSSSGVTVTCLPLTWSRINDSVRHLALIGCGNFQLFAIFRNRAASQDETFVLENADDLRVAQRLPRILG